MKTSNIEVLADRNRTSNAEGPTRPLLSRAPLARMAHIRRLLLRGEEFNAATVARELEVSTKTIFRDIEYMRSALNYEICYVPERFSYAGRPGVITTI
jgi:response regulator of citrate/malate metabolism